MAIIRTFVLTLAGLALLYGFTIQTVDPRGDFGRRPTAGVVLDAQAEKVKSFGAYATRGPVDGLILGSSRSMKIHPQALQAETGLRFFNFAIEGARAEDYLALYRWVRAQGIRPRAIVIGLDVEALHSDDRPELRQPLPGAAAADSGARSGVFTGWLAREKKAFGASYLGDAIRAVVLLPWSSRLPYYAFGPDGYLRYPQFEAQRERGTFNLDRRVADCLTLYLERFQGMAGLSTARRAALEELLRETRGDGARVVIWLTTLHPRAVEYLERRTRYAELVAQAGTYGASLAREPEVRVLDLSAAERYGATASGWYDCGHIDEDNAARVAALLAAAIR